MRSSRWRLIPNWKLEVDSFSKEHSFLAKGTKSPVVNNTRNALTVEVLVRLGTSNVGIFVENAVAVNTTDGRCATALQLMGRANTKCLQSNKKYVMRTLCIHV